MNMSMSEAEILENISNHMGNAIEALSVYLSVTFAYISVAYVVGAKLSRFQVLVGSTLYLFAALVSMIVVYMNIQVTYTLVNLVADQSSLFKRLPLWGGVFWEVYMAVLQGGGILMSFAFMHNSRSKAGRDSE
jgi:hypothetical protein